MSCLNLPAKAVADMCTAQQGLGGESPTNRSVHQPLHFGRWSVANPNLQGTIYVSQPAGNPGAFTLNGKRCDTTVILGAAAIPQTTATAAHQWSKHPNGISHRPDPSPGNHKAFGQTASVHDQMGLSAIGRPRKGDARWKGLRCWHAAHV